jgi:LPXTG-motif cell wall-anchored protein
VVLLALAVTALATTSAAAPVASAQSAGDRQYSDPLVEGDGSRQPPPEPRSGGEDSAGATTPTPPAGAPAPSADDGASAGEPAALPRTGAETVPLAVAGLVLLALGALARPRGRRRAAT